MTPVALHSLAQLEARKMWPYVSQP
jgi:hypothetical protein